ncbi:hypothetical protein ACFQ2B_31960 [Streptomyces stramineus]
MTTSTRPVVLANPNTLSDRAAMGLPDTFVARAPQEALAAHRDLLGAEPAALVALAEDPAEPFARRYAAGTVLGLVGDPRVRPEDPPMADIPAARARLGLDPAEAGRSPRAGATRASRRSGSPRSAPATRWTSPRSGSPCTR